MVETDVLSLHQLPLTAGEFAIEAQGWQDLLRAKNQEIADATIALRSLEGDAAATMRERIAETSAGRACASDDARFVR